ncbi:hypothetical protein E2C01_042348 [Portunus trituberculatus]|uniref:Uncharacterized protein n=1 Tax=Portunus trituberculatus TaxID=210409 RepID=A0A5B7FPZ4_PORTR|nr:hypothetical protein [Portunus trituberculatus]
MILPPMTSRAHCITRLSYGEKRKRLTLLRAGVVTQFGFAVHADNHSGLAVRLRDVDTLGVGEVDYWHPHLTHGLVRHSSREPAMWRRAGGQRVTTKTARLVHDTAARRPTLITPVLPSPGSESTTVAGFNSGSLKSNK